MPARYTFTYEFKDGKWISIHRSSAMPERHASSANLGNGSTGTHRVLPVERSEHACKLLTVSRRGWRFDSCQGVRYLTSNPSALKQRGKVTPSVHHSDDLDGMNRIVISVGPCLIEDDIGRSDQHPGGSEYFRVTLAYAGAR
ncbi:hypothetical protein J2W42_005471 [Rhizobium tibeticum]|nr:hypothetical protein [Rhizobium tibeticum]